MYLCLPFTNYTPCLHLHGYTYPCPGSLPSSGQSKQAGSNTLPSGSTSTRVQVAGSNDTKQHLTGHSSNPFNPPGVTSINGGGGGSPGTGINKSELATPISLEGQPGSYSTALTITITIGVSLLILNMLLFFGLYYHMDRRKERPTTGRHVSPSGNYDASNGSEESDLVHRRNTNNSKTAESQQYYVKSRNRNTVTFNEVCTSLLSEQ